MRSLSILVVEDDLLIGMLLTETLEGMGHRVCGVETTESTAVTAALLRRPDLMIVDSRLRHGNGVSAMETISKTVQIPHIFISGDRISDKVSSRFDLQKPFSECELVRAIKGTMALAA
jgi:DNA-binding response OmpR family regulator